MTEGFSLNGEQKRIHLNPVSKGLVKRPEDGRWLSYNNFALVKATLAVCPTQLDDARLPLGYRA